MTANGLGLGEEAELKAQMFGLAQMLIRIPNVQFSTEPAFFCKTPVSGSLFFQRLVFRNYYYKFYPFSDE
jgi:hypothetical protein